MIGFTEYPDREAWLAGRGNTIGASEIASVLGCGFCTAQELWALKVGESTGKDLSESPRVKYGSEAEQHLRALFALQFADKYEVEYHPFRVYVNDEYPYLSCTLDGELANKANGEMGVWECKTAFVARKEDMNAWGADTIPNKYYAQVQQQLAVTQRNFAVLTAQLIFQDGSSQIRHYDISRSETDIAYIVSEAQKFWKHVTERTKPKLTLTL